MVPCVGGPPRVNERGRSFGGTILFPKALNLTWTETFKVARSRKTVYLTNFEAKLQAAINTPVMLYSVLEKRAWMVSFVSVLLHVARARAHCQRSLGFRVLACDISANGGQAAYETIMSCYRERLKHAAPDEMLDELEESLTIKDYISDVWAALDCATRETKENKRSISNADHRLRDGRYRSLKVNFADERTKSRRLCHWLGASQMAPPKWRHYISIQRQYGDDSGFRQLHEILPITEP